MLLSIINFFQGQFMPHGHCYFWRPDILWTNVIGDGLIALAYFSIPFLLVYFLRKRSDIRFRGIFYLFAMFILSCGITHVLTIVSVWEPIYAFEGIAKVFTASVSSSTFC
ncbi:MAG: hypothetical protein WD048_00515 [Chitinophagales bacterium]